MAQIRRSPRRSPPPDHQARRREICTRLHQQGIDLPFAKTTSPNKASNSPRTKALKVIDFLLYSDYEALSCAINGFVLRTPPSGEDGDRKLDRLRQSLDTAIKASPKSSRIANRRIVAQQPHEDMHSPPGSPTSSIKHNKAPIAPDPPLIPGLNDEDEDGYVHVPGADITSRAPALQHSIVPGITPGSVLRKSSQKLAQRSDTMLVDSDAMAGVSVGKQIIRSANTTFDSAIGMSFTSTVPDDVPCLDGANDLEPTQTTSVYPGASQIDWNMLEISSHQQPRSQMPPSSTEYEPFHITATQADTLQHSAQHRPRTPPSQILYKEFAGDGVPTSPPKQLNQEVLQSHPCTPKTGAQPQKSPPTRSPSRYYRVERIIADGLPHVKLPASLAYLRLDLRWEASRVLQTKIISASELEEKWQEPRTMASLHGLVDTEKIRMEKGFETDFSDCSLVARLRGTGSKKRTDPLLELELLPPIRQKHNEFEREYGADRMIIIEYIPPKIPAGSKREEMDDAVAEMISNDYELLGRQWVEIFAREKKRKGPSVKAGTMEFFLFACSGIDIPTVSLGAKLQRHLCLDANADQWSAKIYSRQELKASRTTAAYRIHIDQIEYRADLPATDVDICEESLEFQDPACQKQFAQARQEHIAEMDANGENKNIAMTDGCGEISAWLMRKLMHGCGYDGPMPSAVQGRFAGAKGVWLLRRDETLYNPDSPAPSNLISITDSQMKIKQSKDRQEFTFYVLKFAAPPKPSVLHPGFLPILCDRHVPREKIMNFSVGPIERLPADFAEEAKDPVTLCTWFHKQGDLVGTRDSRDSKTVGGFPNKALEKILWMLQNGFSPHDNRYLSLSSKKKITKMLEMRAAKYKIECTNATTLMGVPDFTGTLKPGEVHIKLSQGWDDFTPSEIGQKYGQVIAGRNPARRPGDLQRLRIVQKEELSHLVDVVVFSTQGRQPEASKMQGGDYDGDLFWVCWEPELVLNFLNAPAPRESDRRKPSELGLEVDHRKFRDIVPMPTDSGIPPDEVKLRQWLKINTRIRMRFSWLGTVSRVHEFLVHYLGTLTSPALDVLNDLCDYLLDAHKQCLSFSEEAWNKLRKDLRIPDDLPRPAYHDYTTIEADDDEDEHISEQKKQEKRQKTSKPRADSIIDQVYCVKLQTAATKAIELINAMFPNTRLTDEDLTGDFDALLTQLSCEAKAELQELRRRMIDVADYYKSAMEHLAASPGDWSVKSDRYLSAKQEARQRFDAIQPLNTSNELIKFWLLHQPKDRLPLWTEYKAVALFSICYHDRYSKVPFNVVGKELCEIKSAREKDGKPRQTMTGSAASNVKPAKMTEMKRKRLQEERERNEVGGKQAAGQQAVGLEVGRAQPDLLSDDVTMGGCETPARKVGQQTPSNKRRCTDEAVRRALAGKVSTGDLIDLTSDG